MKKIGRLHILTDVVLQSRFSHFELTELALTGGADTVQFRQKSGSTREMILLARRMQNLCRESGVCFIVNDRVDVAIASQADGVHLGQDDFPIPLARKLLGPKAVIGGSASTLEEARKCFLEGADYIGFGPVFPTTSKEDAGPVGGLDLLSLVLREVPLPVVAIGGIGLSNAREIIQCGAHGIAVISAVCCQPDPREATENLKRVMESA